MKILHFLSVGLIVLGLSSCNNGDNSQTEGTDSTAVTTENSENVAGQRYGIKSGIVYYEPMDMMGIKSTQVLYFDDYGAKEARETITEGNIMGFKTKKRSVSIIDGKWAISFDTENMTNGKDELVKKASKVDMSNNPFGQMDFTALGEEMKKKMDYKEEGTEEVAGVTGTKFSIKMTENASQRISGVMYKNVSLKVDMGQIKMVASKFEQNVSIPADMFKVPAGYEVVEEDPFAAMNQAE